MINFSDVSVNFGTQDVLCETSFKINAGERCGIVGPNGAGKSTLFNLITGECSPEHGTIFFEGSKPSIGYLHQQLNRWDASDTLLSYTLRASKRIRELEKNIHCIETEILESAVHSKGRHAALNRLGELQTEYEHLGGYDLRTHVKEALGGLGFKNTDFNRPFSEFSGGWKMRAELVRTLVTKPDLLMLDEPSNYLDLPAVEWMQRFLKEYQGTLLLISHDRFLLRTLTNVTLEVDGCTVTRYNGGLDFYLRERVQRYETLLAAKNNQDRLRDQMQRFIDTFRYTASKAAQVQSRIKMIEKMEPIEVPQQASAAGHIRLPDFHHCGTTALSVKNAGFSYDGKDWVFRNVSFEIGRGEHVALVGFNGMGKTTLSRLLSGTYTPSEGNVLLGHKVVPGYVSQDFSETIPPERSLINVVRNEDPGLSEASARGLLGSFGFSGDDAFKTEKVLSGGEKIRLAFARIFAAKPNLLVLDEPTTHLDINGTRALEEALVNYKGTVVLVSHDIEFVRKIAGTIIEITHAGVQCFIGGYDDYRERTATNRPKATNPKKQTENKPSPLNANTDSTTVSKKERRKQRAIEREQQNRKTGMLKRRVTAAETRIEQLENKQVELVTQLSGETEKIDFENVNRRLSEIQTELATVNLLWEQAASELAILNSV